MMIDNEINFSSCLMHICLFHLVFMEFEMKLSYILLFSQYMNEKIGGAEGTKLDDDFMDMEKVR